MNAPAATVCKRGPDSVNSIPILLGLRRGENAVRKAKRRSVEVVTESFLNILLKTSCAIVADESLCRRSLRASREKVAIHESDLNVAL